MYYFFITFKKFEKIEKMAKLLGHDYTKMDKVKSVKDLKLFSVMRTEYDQRAK